MPRLQENSRHLFVILLWIIGIPLQTFPQQLDTNLLNSTVLVRRQVDPSHESRGSGFLIFREIAKNATAGTSTYQFILVTNKHVLPQEHSQYPQISIRIAIRNANDIQTIDLPITILMPDGTFSDMVAMNPDSKVDVAAVNVTRPLSAVRSDFITRATETHTAVTTDLLLPTKEFQAAAIGIGTQIYLLGYPDGITDPRNISPILRVGIISTEPEKEFSFDPQKSEAYNLPSPIPGFLIDANVFPGSSGSMVVRRTNIVPGFYPGGKWSAPFILGIVADSIPIQDLGAVQRMGLGVVFNSDTILDTIKLLPAISK
jgi:hypothetical protein